ncbi:hypothetical protein M9H77_35072 [Catharanthus roseus]|uniref:Uncharacterized protein n=1 Tax=Catharanthus roseus TaxID=4058 RepID=A0ACB9ZS80_CATRO|nr:hypothetical protein M9H77_35072 [Catharanthus roseus]
MLYTTVTDDDAEIDHSDEEYVASSQSKSYNDAEEEDLQTPVIRVMENTVTQWESSQLDENQENTKLQHTIRGKEYTWSDLRSGLLVPVITDTRADTYMPDIYLRETYRRTYEANFHPVLNENYWRDVPYNLIFYPLNMNKERSMKQGTRFQGKMDYRNLDSSPRYGRCRMSGHNRKNCNNSSPSNV